MNSEMMLNLLATAAEVALLLVLYFLVRFSVSRVWNVLTKNIKYLQLLSHSIEIFNSFALRLFSILCFIVGTVIIILNIYLATHNINVAPYIVNFLEKVNVELWQQLGISTLWIVGTIFVAFLVRHLLKKALHDGLNRLKTHEKLQLDKQFLDSITVLLNQMISVSVIFVLLLFLFQKFSIFSLVSNYMSTGFSVYIIIAASLALNKIGQLSVSRLPGLIEQLSSSEKITLYLQRIIELVPFFGRCVDYAIYVIAATLVLSQLSFIAQLATYGPGIAQAIGVVFLAKVVISLLDLLLEKYFLPTNGISDIQRRQRLTLLPTTKSFAKGFVYFVAGILILYCLGVDPTPILVSAGALSFVIGLAARAIIGDFLAGIIIFSENLFLVGDAIQIGNVKGKVESIGMRTTSIRDANGQLHIFENGHIGTITQFSRGYMKALVEIGIDYKEDLQHVYSVLQGVSKKLQASNNNVLEPIEIVGIASIDGSGIVIRTRTKVKPGCHAPITYQLNQLIKEGFDAAGIQLYNVKKIKQVG